MKTTHILYLAALAALASCSPDKAAQEPEKPVSVTTYLPYATSGNGELLLSGTVTARQTAAISTRMMGTIERVHVRQGDAVRQGQPLLTINSTDLRARQAQARAMIAAAEAAAGDARKDHQRYQALRNQNSVSDKELENMALRSTSAAAQLQVARQQLREVNAQLAYTHITAPFAGVITQRMADEGSIANPGMPLLMLEQSGDLNVSASVPESDVAQVRVGAPATVEIKSLGLAVPGRVSELSPSAAQTGGQYALKIDLRPADRQQLKAGMYAAIRLKGTPAADTEPRLWVKKSSVVEREQLTGVYVMSADGRAVLHWVRLGREMGERVMVLSGLNAADRVIHPAGVKLHNGLSVKPASERR